jgi:hypothetical protein
MAVILVTEIVVLRNGIYNFYDSSVLERPDSVAVVQRDEDYQDFYAYHLNSRIGFVFLKPNDPALGRSYRKYLSVLVAFPALQWGIPSINGALALDLHRRAILDDVLLAESLGKSDTASGNRLIDVLGVRYFSFTEAIDTPGFTQIFNDPESSVWVYRNDYAMPKLRIYGAAHWVQSPEEAMERVPLVSSDTIVIESDSPPVDAGMERCKPGGASMKIERHEISSQYYKVAVESPCPGWLYLGDAYYPGWSALVDGVPADLYPAQVMGKAVRIPQGSSVVEFVYRPGSFYTGAIISGITWLALCIFMLWRGYLFFRRGRSGSGESQNGSF